MSRVIGLQVSNDVCGDLLINRPESVFVVELDSSDGLVVSKLVNVHAARWGRKQVESNYHNIVKRFDWERVVAKLITLL